MMHRTIRDVLARTYAALQDGRFAEARDMAAPYVADPAARLLHALGQAGSGGSVEATLDRIARANPTARHPVHDLLDLLRRAGRGAEQAQHLRAALASRPDDARLLTALGVALSEHGDPGAMLRAFEAASAQDPRDAATWSNLGNARAAVLDFVGAEQAFDQATRLRPDDARFGLNQAVARLKSGELAAGWGPFRARHRLPGRAPAPPGLELTTADGVAGKTVLLLHDEGFGDTIQFIRYGQLLEARGARVLVTVPPPLGRLLTGNGFRVVEAHASADAWCRIPDLPMVFGTTLETIPSTLPYLVADPVLVQVWSGRLPLGFPRVGLVWAGAARPADPAAAATDRVRSIARERLGPLLESPDVAWVSLQHGQAPPPGVFDPMPAVTDFADTAAVIAGLDLVVSVDTAVAHLAAAMGRRVLLLDRFDNCWRWLSGRSDSPWYPGVLQIVRQVAPGGWDSVLDRARMLIEANGRSR